MSETAFSCKNCPIEAHFCPKADKTVLELRVGFLIPPADTIRLSAGSLIAFTDSLIIVTRERLLASERRKESAVLSHSRKGKSKKIFDFKKAPSSSPMRGSGRWALMVGSPMGPTSPTSRTGRNSPRTFSSHKEREENLCIFPQFLCNYSTPFRIFGPKTSIFGFVWWKRF